MRAALVIAALATACNSGSGSSDGAGAGPREPAPDAPLITVEGAETAPDKLGAEPSLPTEVGEPPEVVDLDQSVERLGAIPAWQAVIDRNQYLERRGESAVVFGVVGGALPPATLPDAGVVASDQVWLVDETEGNGALAIRVRFGDKAIAPGARVAVRGAWVVDDHRRWVWSAAEVTTLPPPAEPPTITDPPAAPGLTIVAADPPGPRSKVKLPAVVRDGELMEFTVTAPPPRTGDGWSISDRRWGELFAFLVLPGERDSFGGHDLRHADERWQLKKGATYWVRVAKVRRREGKTTVIIAATPPVRFP